MNGTNAQIAQTLIFVLRQYYELTDLPDSADDEAVYEWIKGRLAEADRLRVDLLDKEQECDEYLAQVDRLQAERAATGGAELGRVIVCEVFGQCTVIDADGNAEEIEPRLTAEVTRLRAAEQRVRDLLTEWDATPTLMLTSSAAAVAIAALEGAEEPPRSEPAKRGDGS